MITTETVARGPLTSANDAPVGHPTGEFQRADLGTFTERHQRRDLEGAAFEADVVRMLVALPKVAINLRQERGQKTDDYDIDVWLGSNRRWAIEVKTRNEDSSYSDKALNRTLDRARRQLPRDALGTIFLKVPTPWLADSDYSKRHVRVVSDFLRKTNRVHAVVLVRDVWVPKDSGRGFNWHRAVKVVRATHIDAVVNHLLDFYMQSWNQAWDFGPSAPF